MKRASGLKGFIVGAAMMGLTLVGAGTATADTATMFGRDGGSVVAATAYTTDSTDYGRGTTRSDNSPSNAGGLS